MIRFSIKVRDCSNAYGGCFEVWQDDVNYYVGTFSHRCWAEAWIADMIASLAGR